MSERPDKVKPVEYKVISDPVDQLDTILSLLNHHEDVPEGFGEVRHRLKYKRLRISDKDLQIAVDKLCDDKYLAWVSGQTRHGMTSDKFFYITHHGRIFFKSFPSLVLRDRPYKRQVIIQSIQSVYKVMQTVTIILYSVMIALITYWGIKLTDKTNKLEQRIEEESQVKERLEFKIDSLTKLTTDTTRLRIK